MPTTTTRNRAQEEAERREIEAILESGILRNAPNLQRFFEYVAEKHFEGTADQVKEYSIAVQALHRPAQFDPQADAIVRVSAHALRKKLEHFYAGEGADHPIQICLPAGKYVLQFTRNPAYPSVEGDAAAQSWPPVSHAAPSRGERRWWKYAVAAVGALIVIAALAYWRRESAGASNAAAHASGSAAPPESAIRIHLGDGDTPYIDAAGQTWMGDRYCKGGAPYAHPGHAIQGSDDPGLYQQGREGKFACAIPAPPGNYQLYFLFADTAGDQVGARQVVYSINTGPEDALDVVDDAGGDDVAVGKAYTGIHPENDGAIHLNFLSEGAFVDGIEILPAAPGNGFALRMVAGPVALKDEAGNTWLPERFFSGGRRSFHPENLPGGPNPRLFQWSRYGNFQYRLPVPANYEYKVNLYFSENWFGAKNGGPGGVGSRVFDVYCNGTTLLKDFDILKEQKNGSVVMTLHHVRPTAHGMLDLHFTPIKNYSLINAVEVEAEN